MSLPLGFVRGHDQIPGLNRGDGSPINISDCLVLKRDPQDTYVNPDGNTRLKPPTFTQTTFDEFAKVQTGTTPPDPPQILWDYHYDLMNDFEWNYLQNTPLAGKRFPRKFKWRICKVVKTFDPISLVYDTANTLGEWVTVEFAAVIMPNFRSGLDVGVVTESEPTPAALFEGSGPPDDTLGHSGDFYFDLDTSDGTLAVLYGPKMAIDGDGDTPQNRSVGTWVIDPTPPLVDIASTRAMAQFAQYKTKKGQCMCGQPNLEYATTFRIGSSTISRGGLPTYAPIFQTPDQFDPVDLDPFHPYIPWVPRWPTDNTFFFNESSEFDIVLTSAAYRLPLFKPAGGGPPGPPPPIAEGSVAPMWNAASNQPVWGTDFFNLKFQHPYATTFRLGDYRTLDPSTIGVGNAPWPQMNRTTTAQPTFGMWTPGQIQPHPLFPTAPPVFNHALLVLPLDFCPIGGREATAQIGGTTFYDEQINPVPIDPFFYDSDHPDGEYGTEDEAPWPDSNMHICTGFTHQNNPDFPSNPTLITYMVQTTVIFDP